MNYVLRIGESWMWGPFATPAAAVKFYIREWPTTSVGRPVFVILPMREPEEI